MKLALFTIAVPVLLAGCALGPKAEDHAAHHPSGAAPTSSTAPPMAQMDSMMKSMQDMHDRMMAAKTPDERAALMKDHRKLMQDGMGMMGRMRGGTGMGGAGMPTSPEMMGKCMGMGMMEMMMQMMMDREATKPPSGK